MATQTPSYSQLAEDILDTIGQRENVVLQTRCMTRLRITLQRPELADHSRLRQLPGVLGVVPGNPLQLVLGPDAVNQVASAVEAALAQPASAGAASAPVLASPAPSKSAPVTPPAAPRLPQLLHRIASVCTPLIPALIGAGLVKALAELLQLLSTQFAPQHLTYAASIAALIGSAFFTFLMIQVGMNAAREFGGTASLGGAAAGVMLLPAVAELPPFVLPWLGTIHLQPGQGGLMGAMCAGALVALCERALRKRLPRALATLLVPSLTLLATGTLTLLVLMPVANLLTDQAGQATQMLLKQGGVLAAFMLAAGFIVLLMFGLHQALIPIHVQLISQYGYSALFPILAMSGCGQAGAALALYFKSRDPQLRRRILETLPTCMLGISEPLLYSVTLPLGRPVLTCSAGAGVGAMVLGYFASHGDYVGATAIGPANLLLIPLVSGPLGTGSSIAVYSLATLLAYLSAFVLTWCFSAPDPVINTADTNQ